MATRTRFLALIALLIALAGGWWLAKESQSAPLRPQVRFPDGLLRIGIDPSYHPFALDNNGHFDGFDVELAQALATELGLQVQLVAVGFDGQYDALFTGRVDVLTSVGVDSTRSDKVIYTQPYTDTGWVLVSRPSDRLSQWQELGNRQLAVEFGSEGDAMARGWLRRLQPFTLLPYELPEYALDALRTGDANAALVAALTFSLYPASGFAHVFVTHEPIALAVRAGDNAAADLLNDALQTLESDGILTTLRHRWLGQNADAPGN